MIKWIISISLLVTYSSIFAHQPDVSSTILMEQEDGNWILQIRVPLTALEYEVNLHFGEGAFSTPEEFQELVLKHIIDNVVINVDGKRIVTLENGLVKLGHESNVLFQLNNMPESIADLTVTNSSFADIGRNQSALIVLKNGFDKNQFVLNEANDHEVSLITKDSKFLMKQHAVVYNQPKWQLIGLAVLSICFFLVFKMRKTKIQSVS